MRPLRPTNRAICLALLVAIGLPVAATPAAAWPTFRRAPRTRKVVRPARKPTTGRTVPARGQPAPTLSQTRRPRFGSVGELPRPRPGTVRLYRGTGHPDRLQVAPSMRRRPAGEVPRGDQSFFGPFEATRVAERHAFGAHDASSDAVSTTTDLHTARTYAATNGGAVLVYDVPLRTFEQLPHGDRTAGEKIFRYSVPDDFLVGVLTVDKR